jgi:hypothetical protein
MIDFRILIIAACSILLAWTAVSAEENQKDDLCATYAELAETIMRSHQSGVSLSQVFEVMGSDSDPLVRELVIKAYDKPRYRTDQAKNRAISDYRDFVHVECLKQVSQ